MKWFGETFCWPYVLIKFFTLSKYSKYYASSLYLLSYLRTKSSLYWRINFANLCSKQYQSALSHANTWSMSAFHNLLITNLAFMKTFFPHSHNTGRTQWEDPRKQGQIPQDVQSMKSLNSSYSIQDNHNESMDDEGK